MFREHRHATSLKFRSARSRKKEERSDEHSSLVAETAWRGEGKSQREACWAAAAARGEIKAESSWAAQPLPPEVSSRAELPREHSKLVSAASTLPPAVQFPHRSQRPRDSPHPTTSLTCLTPPFSTCKPAPQPKGPASLTSPPSFTPVHSAPSTRPSLAPQTIGRAVWTTAAWAEAK